MNAKHKKNKVVRVEDAINNLLALASTEEKLSMSAIVKKLVLDRYGYMLKEIKA